MVSADRSSGCRSAWSGIRARASQLRQNWTVASIAPSASSASAGAARPSAHDSAQNALSPLVSTCRARAAPPSMPISMSVLSRNAVPGAVGRVGAVALVVDQGPRGRDPAVVERRLADELDLDRALEALDGADEQVVGVVVGRRPGVRGHGVRALPGPHRQRVVHQRPSRPACARWSSGRWCRARRCGRSAR